MRRCAAFRHGYGGYRGRSCHADFRGVCHDSRLSLHLPKVRLGAYKEYREYDLLGKGEAEKANLSSNIVSVLQAGAFLGALVAMWLANRVGRRWSLIIASILIFIGVAMQAGASGTMAVMYLGR